MLSVFFLWYCGEYLSAVELYTICSLYHRFVIYDYLVVSGNWNSELESVHSWHRLTPDYSWLDLLRLCPSTTRQSGQIMCIRKLTGVL